VYVKTFDREKATKELGTVGSCSMQHMLKGHCRKKNSISRKKNFSIKNAAIKMQLNNLLT